MYGIGSVTLGGIMSTDNGDEKEHAGQPGPTTASDKEQASAAIPKTPEQIKAERIVEFAKDPDAFIRIDMLIVAMAKRPDGELMSLVNKANRTEYEICQSRLNHLLEQQITGIEMKVYAEQQQNAKIAANLRNTQGKKGFRNFLKFGRR